MHARTRHTLETGQPALSLLPAVSMIEHIRFFSRSDHFRFRFATLFRCRAIFVFTFSDKESIDIVAIVTACRPLDATLDGVEGERMQQSSVEAVDALLVAAGLPVEAAAVVKRPVVERRRVNGVSFSYQRKIACLYAMQH